MFGMIVHQVDYTLRRHNPGRETDTDPRAQAHNRKPEEPPHSRPGQSDRTQTAAHRGARATQARALKQGAQSRSRPARGPSTR